MVSKILKGLLQLSNYSTAWLLIFHCVSASVLLNTAQAQSWPTLSGAPTLVNAHRGETVLVPENTLAAVELASIERADYVELDIAVTSDGVLVCFHDLTLKETTDVADRPQFADKLSNYTGPVEEDGGEVIMLNNWFIKDFTLEELRQLRVKQRERGIRPKTFDGFFGIPTFEEYLDTLHHTAFKLNRSAGIVPELKSPFFYNLYQNHTPRYTENLVLSTLSFYGYPIGNETIPNCRSKLDADASITCPALIIQSFDYKSMLYLHSAAPRVSKSMLVGAAEPHLTYSGLADLATWATYVSPAKGLLRSNSEITNARQGDLVPPSEIVGEAHRLGMGVFIWTIYDSYESENKKEELDYYFEMGVDGIFSENVPETREMRTVYYYEVIMQQQKVRRAIIKS